MLRSIGAVVLLFALAALAFAGDVWVEKPYTEWSKKDCEKLLRDSPWSDRYVMRKAVIEPIGRETAADRTERADVSEPEIFYQAQIRSALPIRQALVRLRQLQMDVEKMTEEQLRAVDAQAEQFLAMEFPDTIVVYVIYGSNVSNYDRELAFHWQSQTFDTLRDEVFLNGNERVPLSGFSPTQGGARAFQFIFPRTYNGRPVLAEGGKAFNLEFKHPDVSVGVERQVVGATPEPQGRSGIQGAPVGTQRVTGYPTTRVFLKFNPKKMKVGDKLVL